MKKIIIVTLLTIASFGAICAEPVINSVSVATSGQNTVITISVPTAEFSASAELVGATTPAAQEAWLKGLAVNAVKASQKQAKDRVIQRINNAEITKLPAINSSLK